MLSKNAPTLFSYKDSKFGVHKSKVSCLFVCVCMCLQGCDTLYMYIINVHLTHVPTFLLPPSIFHGPAPIRRALVVL